MELSKDTMSEIMARQRKIIHVLRLGFHSAGSSELVSRACSFAETASAASCVNDDSLTASPFVISFSLCDRPLNEIVHRSTRTSCAMYRLKLGSRVEERSTSDRFEPKIEKVRQECGKIFSKEDRHSVPDMERGTIVSALQGQEAIVTSNPGTLHRVRLA